MTEMHRVLVVGSSGSGKTTVASQIADRLNLPHLELDAVMHADGWNSTPDPEFQRIVGEFASNDHWVIDGNYTSHGMVEVVWPRADTVVWTDMPRRVVMSQVIRRTLRRMVTREKLWNGLTEPLSNLYKRDPYENIIVWAWTRYDHVREKYETAIADGSWDHAVVHRLRSRGEVRHLLGSIAVR